MLSVGSNQSNSIIDWIGFAYLIGFQLDLNMANSVAVNGVCSNVVELPPNKLNNLTEGMAILIAFLL